MRVEEKLVLSDGSHAVLRKAALADAPGLFNFFQTLSLESRCRRFFSAVNPPIEWLTHFCEPASPRSQLTLIVAREENGRPEIVATASYVAQGAKTAEVAFAVADAYQGKGIGALLLDRLAAVAIEQGFSRFWAAVLPHNMPMMEVFRHSGFQMSTKVENGLLQVTLDLAPSGMKEKSGAQPIPC